MTSLATIFSLFPVAKELNVKNVVNVLHEAKFADGDWPKLGLQLIDHTALATIKSDYGESSLCMIETISRWLKTDSEASWEKLAEAVLKVGRCGEATANIVQEKGGIVHTGMFGLMNTFFLKCNFIGRNLNCSCRNNSESTRRNFFSTTIDF